MAEQKGIKETKEALMAIMILGAFVAERAKDGVDLSDAIALATKLAMDADFSKKLNDGVMGLELVSGEMKDLSFAEMIELSAMIPDLLKIFKK